MRPRWLWWLAAVAALVAVPAARAQVGIAAPGGNTAQLAQFQPGIRPLGSNLDLNPGQSVRLALNCVDLFANTPTDRVAFVAPPSDAIVTLSSSEGVGLSEAIDAGLIQVRGHGPMDPGPRTGGPWFDVIMTNVLKAPVHVSMPAGTLFVPAGQPTPEVSPKLHRLLVAAQTRGLLGSDTLANAVWATRGFTREDVEQTTMAPLPDAEVQRVQGLLAAADLGYNFTRGSGDYARLYEQKRTAMGNAAPSVHGTALLPNGKLAQIELVADTAGSAVAVLTIKDAAPLYYAGQIIPSPTGHTSPSDRLRVQLSHLKTRRPLEIGSGPLLVKLASP